MVDCPALSLAVVVSEDWPAPRLRAIQSPITCEMCCGSFMVWIILGSWDCPMDREDGRYRYTWRCWPWELPVFLIVFFVQILVFVDFIIIVKIIIVVIVQVLVFLGLLVDVIEVVDPVSLEALALRL